VHRILATKIQTCGLLAINAMYVHRPSDRYGGGEAGDDGSELPSFCSWFRLMYRFSSFIYTTYMTVRKTVTSSTVVKNSVYIFATAKRVMTESSCIRIKEAINAVKILTSMRTFKLQY